MFLEKKQWFLLSKKECVNEYLQICKKTWLTAGRKTVTSGFWTAATPNMFIIQDTKDSSDLNSARYGQFNYRLNQNKNLLEKYSENLLLIDASESWWLFKRKIYKTETTVDGYHHLIGSNR